MEFARWNVPAFSSPQVAAVELTADVARGAMQRAAQQVANVGQLAAHAVEDVSREVGDGAEMVELQEGSVVTCVGPHATCHMPYAACHTLHAKCYMPHATCHTLHATCHMPHATRLLRYLPHAVWHYYATC